MPTPKLAIQRRRKSCAKNVSRLTKTPGSKEENLIAMNLSVECTSILGQCKESLAFHEKALELKKKIKDKKKVATSCCAISSLYYNLEALKISEEIKDREMEGVAYANLSNV